MDPFTGHWVVDLKDSRFIGPVPAEWTQDIDASPTHIRARERVVASNGAVNEYFVEGGFDGAEYPVTGSPLVDTMSYARPEPNRIDGVGHKAGKVVFLEVVMADGDALTMALAIPRPDGSAVEAVVVFRRQDGGPS